MSPTIDTNARHGNEMNMIGHQTPRENGYPVPRDFFAEHLEILLAILLGIKHLHGANTTLCNVMRISGDYDARQTSHRKTLLESNPRVNSKLVLCPQIPLTSDNSQ
jgi:hypothetical protein